MNQTTHGDVNEYIKSITTPVHVARRMPFHASYCLCYCTLELHERSLIPWHEVQHSKYQKLRLKTDNAWSWLSPMLCITILIISA